MPAKSSLYDRDFYAWSVEQAALLREGRVAEADLENSPRNWRAWARRRSASSSIA